MIDSFAGLTEFWVSRIRACMRWHVRSVRTGAGVMDGLQESRGFLGTSVKVHPRAGSCVASSGDASMQVDVVEIRFITFNIQQ